MMKFLLVLLAIPTFTLASGHDRNIYGTWSNTQTSGEHRVTFTLDINSGLTYFT